MLLPQEAQRAQHALEARAAKAEHLHLGERLHGGGPLGPLQQGPLAEEGAFRVPAVLLDVGLLVLLHAGADQSGGRPGEHNEELVAMIALRHDFLALFESARLERVGELRDLLRPHRLEALRATEAVLAALARGHLGSHDHVLVHRARQLRNDTRFSFRGVNRTLPRGIVHHGDLAKNSSGGQRADELWRRGGVIVNLDVPSEQYEDAIPVGALLDEARLRGDPLQGHGVDHDPEH
mmetsp:Transcript_7491/g.22136  ORF Transcript_7491/g.22136 Transcript_7491/m.22136 type:complete len:236 (+) Transcript_7491:163-870(+)